MPAFAEGFLLRQGFGGQAGRHRPLYSVSPQGNPKSLGFSPNCPHMSIVRSFGHQYGNKYTILALLTALIALFMLLSGDALAAEVTLQTPSPVISQFTSPLLQLPNPTLPLYSFTGAGSAISTASPLTIPGTRVVVAAKPLPRLPIAEPVAPAPGTPVLVMEGQASFYSRAGCLGCNAGRIMANGQPLNDNALTMAIGANKKHLVGRTARVTSLATGKTALVRITDTGGFYAAKYGNRVADLTIGTKQAIGMAGGVGHVRVEVF